MVISGNLLSGVGEQRDVNKQMLFVNRDVCQEGEKPDCGEGVMSALLPIRWVWVSRPVSAFPGATFPVFIPVLPR